MERRKDPDEGGRRHIRIIEEQIGSCQAAERVVGKAGERTLRQGRGLAEEGGAELARFQHYVCFVRRDPAKNRARFYLLSWQVSQKGIEPWPVPGAGWGHRAGPAAVSSLTAQKRTGHVST